MPTIRYNLFAFFLGLSLLLPVLLSTASEVEPNDETAQQITSGQTIEGTLSSAEDDDYYAITTNSSGILTLQFQTDIAQYDGYRFYVIDQENNVFARGVCNQSCVDSAKTLTIGVADAGTYFIYVRSESYYWVPEGTYSMTATFEAIIPSGLELEPNDDTAQPINSGEGVTGSLWSTSDKDYYSLTAGSSGIVEIEFQTDISQYDGYKFYIIDAEGNFLSGGNCSRDCVDSPEILTVALAGAGTYRIFVRSESSYYGPAGSYTMTATFRAGSTAGLELEPNDEQAQVVSSGETILGSMWSSSDRDYYAITTESSATLTLDFQTELSQNEGFQFYVIDEDNNIFASDICDLSCIDSPKTLRVGLAQAGTYFIYVRSESYNYSAPEGTYTMTLALAPGVSALELEPNDGMGSSDSYAPQVITSGETIVGTLSGPNDYDYYAITTGSSGTLKVNILTDPSNTDTYRYSVLDDQGNTLVSGYCRRACDSTDESFSIGLKSAGTFYVRIRAKYSSGGFPSGTYTMTATFSSGPASGVETEPNDESAQMLVLGEDVVGSLWSADDNDYYKVTTDSTGILTVNFQTDVSNSDGYVIYLLNEDGDIFGREICDRSCVDSPTKLKAAIGIPGTYFVYVRSESYYYTPEGTYTLTATFAPGDISGLEIEPNDTLAQFVDSGESIVGSLWGTSDRDYYAITTDSEGILTVSFETDTSQYDGYRFYILDQDEKIYASGVCNQSCNESANTLSVALGVAGTFLIYVRSESSYWLPEGTYTMTASFALGAPPGTELEPNDEIAQIINSGESVVGSLSSSSDKDYFSITTSSAGTLTVEFQTEISQYYGYQFYIIDEHDNVYASGLCARSCKDSPRVLTVALSVAGTYLIYVRGESSYSSVEGTYTITPSFASGTPLNLEFEPNDTKAQDINSGVSITGSLWGASDKDYYAISTESAATLTIEFQTEISQYDGFRFYVLDEDNNIYASGTCNQSCVDSANTLMVGLGAAGTYFLYVRSESSYYAPSGTYTMTVVISSGLPSGVEVEPNDETAQPVDSGDVIVGSLWSADDDDYYAITTDSEGVLTVDFRTDTSQYDGYRFYIVDEQNTVFASGVCNQSCVDSPMTLTIGLNTAGTYFLYVRSESSYYRPYGSYTLTTTFTAGTPSGLEIEPNDDDAQVVGSSDSIIGTLSSATDIDWYELEVGSAGSLTLNMSTERKNYSYYFWFYVVDQQNNILVSDYCGSSCATEPEVIIAGLRNPGIYFIAVTGDSSYGTPEGSYSLTWIYSDEISSDLELEPNDSYDEAQSLVSAQPINGSLSSSEDEDWYALSLSDANALTISFSSDNIDYTDWKISFLDQDRNVIESMLCGGTSCSQDGTSMNINAVGSGSFFVLVESSSGYYYPYGTYQLTVSSDQLPDSPNTPTNLQASQGTYQDRIVVSWNDTQVGNEYILFRATTVDGEYDQLARTASKSYTDTEVSHEVEYFYRVKAANLSGESALSSAKSGYVAVGPSAISDLSVASAGPDYIELTFNAPADSNSSTNPMKRYDVRYSRFEITPGNWGGANVFANSIVPGSPNSSEKIKVSGLEAQAKYWFAVKSIDENDFISGISNVISHDTSAIVSLSPDSFELQLGDSQTTLQTLLVNNLSSTVSISYESIVSGVGNATVSSGASSDNEKGFSNFQSQPPSKMNKKLPDIIPNDIEKWIIKFVDGISTQDKFAIVNGLTALNAKLLRDVVSEDMQLWLFPISKSNELARIFSYLSAHPLVEYTEPSYPIKLRALPTDPGFPDLWGLKNTGQGGGSLGADIGVEQAWNITTGSSDVIVAVFDTGIDHMHPDLTDNIWINEGEIPNNGIDDDSNGYVDDIRGWNYCSASGDVRDDQGHGTHVSGTIGAVAGNNLGIVGVSPNVKIMSLKILAGDNGCPESAGMIDIKLALKYAADKGAVIMNHSWGCAYPDDPFYCPESATINDGIRYTEQRGLLFVHASGNDALDTDNHNTDPWSSEFASAISVAATNRRDNITVFSNFGRKTVDVGAPGDEILSTLPNNSYASYSGTSMASPHVAGAAALLKAYRPSWNFSQIKASLMANVDPTSDLQNRTVSGGRLDAGKSLESLVPAWIYLKDDGSGTIAPGESAEIIFVVDSTGLPNGEHQGAIELNFSGVGSFSRSAAVTLNKGTLFQATGSSSAEFLQEPRNLYISSEVTEQTIDIVWDKVVNAVSYLVQRSESPDGTYTDVGTIYDNTYSDKNASSEQIYYYRLRTNFESGSSAFSKVISAKRSDLRADVEVTTSKLSIESHQLGKDIVIPVTFLNKGPNAIEQGVLKYSIPEGLDHISGIFDGGTCRPLDLSFSCNLGSFEENQSKVVSITVRPVVAADYMISIRGFSSVDDPEDINSSNDTVILTAEIASNYDLSLTGQKDRSTGKRIYIDITNNGPANADNVLTTFEYDGYANLTAVPDRGLCDFTGNTKTCSLGKIDSGTRSKILVSQSDPEDIPLQVFLSSPLDTSSSNNFLSVCFGDASNVDSDGDGICNGVDDDDDDDGLPDSEELDYGTDPLIEDSDSDGYSDADEIDGGTDPLDDDDFPATALNWFLIRALENAKEGASQDAK